MFYGVGVSILFKCAAYYLHKQIIIAFSSLIIFLFLPPPINYSSQMSLQVELLILSYQFYMSSSCLDGVDVLVTFAANRVDSYVSEGDFSCLARLITGVSNFHSLSFILSILVENDQLDLLLHKYSATDSATGTSSSVRGFRMAVITSLKQFNPNDDDTLSMVSPSHLTFTPTTTHRHHPRVSLLSPFTIGIFSVLLSYLMVLSSIQIILESSKEHSFTTNCAAEALKLNMC
jgi:hypothetical protein